MIYDQQPLSVDRLISDAINVDPKNSRTHSNMVGKFNILLCTILLHDYGDWNIFPARRSPSKKGN